MDIPTRALSKYVTEKGVNLSRVSEKTGISYQALRDSLSENGRKRDLRAGEFFQICSFLDINPLELIAIG